MSGSAIAQDSIRQEQVTALPASPQPNVIYYIPGDGSYVYNEDAAAFGQISDDTGGGGSSYCPTPMVITNSADNSIVSTTGVSSFEITGFALDQITGIEIDDVAGNTAVATITAQSFTSIEFDVQAPAISTYTATATGACDDIQWSMVGAAITCLVPGAGSVAWQGISNNVTVSSGAIETGAGAGNGWNQGAHFGVAPANTAASLDFSFATPLDNGNGNFGFIGVRNTAPATIAFGSAGRAIYFQNGTLIAYNNTQNLGNVGSYVVGDSFKIERDAAGVVRFFKNGVVSFTWPGNDTGTWYGATSIFRGSHFTGIQLCHS